MKRLLKNKYFILAVIIFIASFIHNAGKENIQPKQRDEMRVHFIDVGEGDSAFIEFPDGKTMLVDAGEEGEDTLSYLEKSEVEKIDFLVGTHPHSDHIGGLATVVRNMEIGNVYMPKVTHNTAIFEDLLLSIKEKGLTINPVYAGDIIYESDSLLVEILSPKDRKYDNLNNYSVVLKIVYGDTAFLLTGDAEAEILDGIYAKDIDVLKVPHHGALSSLSEAFLDRTSPGVAVISVGEGNQYGHPHDATLDAYKKRNIAIFRTDKNGSVIATSDGLKVTVKGERE
ncbi:MAG: MBL fold metallo-hydrolase [Clostridia bacterium]|nr:MBL fold metallo-hydrolase [Clostridia bacterium]